MESTELKVHAENEPRRAITRCIFIAVVSATILLSGWTASVEANVFGQLGKLYGCIVTWGIVCDTSETVIGTGQPARPIPVTGVPPSLNGLPQFLSWPKGSAKYRFQGTCSSPARPGAVMTVRWEGSWTPSETKQDRPNASETLEITGFEPFLPDRTAGGKIFMFFTARCTRDPWLQSGGCTPWGAYVPDDLREALPDIDRQSFPLTGNVIAPADKRRLYAEYLRINSPSAFANLGLVDRPSAASRQQTYATTPPIALEQPKAPAEQMQPSPQGSGSERLHDSLSPQSKLASPPPYAPSVPIQKKPSSALIFSRGLESGEESKSTEEPVAVVIDRLLHVRSMEGDDIEVEAGVYEVESVMDLQLGLAKEGQPAILLPATQTEHGERLDHSAALLVQGESEERYLVFLRADGMRFDVAGSASGIRSRSSFLSGVVPIGKIKETMVSSSATPSTAPSGSRPPCVENPSTIGPRWLPPGCKMPSVPLPNFPAPTPYLDGTNHLYACVNNYTGAFRIVRATDLCAAGNNEVKVKWQLMP